MWLLLAAPGYSWLALSCSFLSAPASFGSWPVLAAALLVSTPGFLLRIPLSIIFVCFVVVIVVGLFALLALVALVGLVTLIALTLVALIILLILIPVLVSIRYPSCFFLT